MKIIKKIYDNTRVIIIGLLLFMILSLIIISIIYWKPNQDTPYKKFVRGIFLNYILTSTNPPI
jgi:hypothetical protein